VPEIDLVAGRVVVAPPEGLLELADNRGPDGDDVRDHGEPHRGDSDG